jgi:hypothetical protein
MIPDVVKPYIKLIEWGLVVVLAALVFFWYRGKIDEAHERGKTEAEAAMQMVVDEANARTREMELKQQEAQHNAEKYHEELVTSGKHTTDSIAVSLSVIQDALRRNLLPGTMGDPAVAGGAPAGSGSAGELQAAISSFIAAANTLSTSCLADTSELGAILQQARDNGALAH